MSAAQSRLVAAIIKCVRFRVNLLLRETRAVWPQSIVKAEPRGRGASGEGRGGVGRRVGGRGDLFLYK